MMANGAVLLVWLNTRDRGDVPRFALLGGLIGLAALVRWQEATLLALPALDSIMLSIREHEAWSRRVGRAAIRLAAAGAAAIIAFLPQIVVWQVIYG